MGTIRNANEIRPTSLPIYCSACRNQDPEEQHLDFDACVDRGYGTYGIDGAVPVSFDDLILCYSCVKRAGAVAGMIEAEAWQNERTSLRMKLAGAEERAQHAEAHAGHLKAALATRPDFTERPVREMAEALKEHGEQPVDPNLFPKPKLCACGCGEEVKPGRRWRHGHSLRKAKVNA